MASAKFFHFGMLKIKSIVQSLNFMHSLQVTLQVILALKHPRANVTLERLDVTNTMDRGEMLR